MTAEDQLELLRRGAVELVRPHELLHKLRSGRPLVVKAGFDPSAPDIHLGHLVVLRKMRQFQDMGHEVVFVVGDFTASIGDPSGRSKTRPVLDRAAIVQNAETYRDQAVRVLDPERTRLAYNSTWLDELGSSGWVRLASKITVARMLERDDFEKRYRSGQPISLHEFFYPLAQGYDSVALEADVELGGTDQTFNLLVGRDLMREHGLAPQVILTTPLLVGLDGKEKMSKSLGNYIGIAERPEQMYGKLMSISDELMWSYWELTTDEAADGTARLRAEVEAGRLHPMQAKHDLARRLVTEFHGAEAAATAADHFAEVVQRGGTPDELAEIELEPRAEPVALARLLTEAGLAPSASEARRLIAGGGVRVDGERAREPRATLDATSGRSYTLAVGKRRHAAIKFS